MSCQLYIIMKARILLTVKIIISFQVGLLLVSAEQCLERFMNLSLVQYRGGRIDTSVPAEIERMDGETRVMTNIQFTCTSQIDSVILGVDIRTDRDLYPSVQLWRPINGGTKIRLVSGSERMIVYTSDTISRTGIHEYSLTPPLTALTGDYLAVSQPARGDSIVRVYTDQLVMSSFRVDLGRESVPESESSNLQNKMVLLYPISDQSECISSTVSESVVRERSLLIAETIQVSYGRQLIYPDMRFMCNGTINKWIYAGDSGTSNQQGLELQVWRLASGSTDIYNKIGFSEVGGANIINADSNLHEFTVSNPIEFMEGDIFGLHQPNKQSVFVNPFILYHQEHSGPRNFRISNEPVVNPPSSLSFDNLIEIDNDYPLVTMEISQHTASSVMPDVVDGVLITSSMSILTSSAAADSSSHHTVLTTDSNSIHKSSNSDFALTNSRTSFISVNQITISSISSSHNFIASSNDQFEASSSITTYEYRFTQSQPLSSTSFSIPSLHSSSTHTLVISNSYLITKSSQPIDSVLLEVTSSSSQQLTSRDVSMTSSTIGIIPSSNNVSQSILFVAVTAPSVVLVVIVLALCILFTVMAGTILRKRKRLQEGSKEDEGDIVTSNNTAVDLSVEVSCDLNLSYNQVNHHYMKGRGSIDPNKTEYSSIDEPELNLSYNQVNTHHDYIEGRGIKNPSDDVYATVGNDQMPTTFEQNIVYDTVINHYD